jgi:hypothetical protein
MLPSRHIFFGAVFSFLIILFFPQIGWLGFLIIFLSSVLIDFDHYLYYVIKKKDFSLRKSYDWFIENRKIWLKLSKQQKKKFESGIIIFHGIECWIILVLLIFISKLFIFVLIGVLIHMIFDFIDLYRHNMPLHVKFSQIYTHKNNKNKKRFNE